jgi:hypothetical protein
MDETDCKSAAVFQGQTGWRFLFNQHGSHLQNTLRALIFSGEIERSLVGWIE